VSKKELHQLHKQAAQQPASVFKPTLAKGSNAFSAEAMLDNAEFINVSSCTYERVEDTGRATVRAAARATACLIGEAPTLTRTTTLLRLVKNELWHH
jgi:hypothetical protein